MLQSPTSSSRSRSMLDPVGRPLRGKVALVTGGASRTGAAMAVGFARAGARVVVSDLRPTEAVANIIRAERGTALAIRADLGAPGAIPALVRATAAGLGGVDLVVHHAGRPVPEPGVELSEDELDALWQVNVRAGFLLAHHAVPIMREHGAGHVLYTRELDAWAARSGLDPHELARRVVAHAEGFARGVSGPAPRGLAAFAEVQVRGDRVLRTGPPPIPDRLSELAEATEHLVATVPTAATEHLAVAA